MLETLEKLSPQDIVALGVVAFALVTCLVCFPCYLAFVALTGYGPPRVQSICSYILRLAKRRSKFNYHKIVPYVYLGSLPRTMEDLEELKALGVGAMVTLNEAWEMELSNRFVRDDCGLEHLHLPTPDFFAPKQEDIQAAVHFITTFVSKGIGVYVHCNGGKGRSAVCVICFLASFNKLSPELAYDHVISRRRIAPMRGSCGLHKQWRAVKRFCRHFRKHRREAFPEPSPSSVSPDVPVSPSLRNDAGGDANCEVTAKPSDLDRAKVQAQLAQPAQQAELTKPLAKLPSAVDAEGPVHTVPEMHVAVAPQSAPQPLPEPMALVHYDTGDAPGYDDNFDNFEPESSDSEEEPPLLE